MNHKLDKNIKILDELITFCYIEGFRSLKTNIEFEDAKTIIHIEAFGASISDAKINYLKKILNTERQPELEQQYWGLGGESHSYENELLLIGMMVDKTDIDYDNNKISINVTRLE